MLNSDLPSFFQQLDKYNVTSHVDLYLAPAFTTLASACSFSTQRGIKVLAQNVYPQPKGAYTGEVSIPMLKELGVMGVIIGHSERRTLFAEDERLLNAKVRSCLQHSLLPIVCIGETAAQRASYRQVLASQLTAALQQTDSSAVVVAYEPVWAIGTGKTASLAQVQEVHSYLRELCAARLLYGGSVKSDNARALLSLPEVDGVLVGGASLSASSLAQICKSP